MARRGKESDHVSKGPRIQVSSTLEKCSFWCHLFLFPIGLTYLLWLLIPAEILETDGGIIYEYYPRKDYALHMPVSALFLFLAAPLLYAAFNSMTVPDLHSLDTIEDVYTKRSSMERVSSKELSSPTSTLPEICDLDPSTLVWHSRDKDSPQSPSTSHGIGSSH